MSSQWSIRFLKTKYPRRSSPNDVVDAIRRWIGEVFEEINTSAQRREGAAPNVMSSGTLVITSALHLSNKTHRDGAHHIVHWTVRVFDSEGFYVGGTHVFRQQAATFLDRDLESRRSRWRNQKLEDVPFEGKETILIIGDTHDSVQVDELSE
ncbi:hypothetical protein JR316_0009348 [Psilocybe cubensis]|uniref:Uncharacterized protein n=2 Tax=Psilocybe cubensis TaxID=181762 RepID=A0A8H7XV63_PSICU|nr:hypothetical protein JR316_0009348 [Psilocybe cubensis]KAH9478886.1 hypothetical protein JR316_0009348 [Psilocybe cubensis]